MEGPFGEAIDKVKDFIGKLIDAVKLLWENVLVPFFSWIASNIMPILAPIVDFIGSTILTVFETIVKVLGSIADVLGGIIDFVVGVFTGDWKKAWEGIKSIFSGIWNAIKNLLSGIWDFIKNLVKNGIGVVKAVIKAGWEAVKSVTSTVWNAIKGVISTAWNGIKDALKGIPNWFKEKFELLGAGLAAGMRISKMHSKISALGLKRNSRKRIHMRKMHFLGRRQLLKRYGTT